jgi:hypothetical protein
VLHRLPTPLRSTPNLTLDGLIAGAYQCQQLTDGSATDDACRGALVFQPELAYAPTDSDLLFVKLGVAAGNGLNTVSPFELAPWGADLEDDVKDINGTGRSYLLEAWYAHSFRFGADNQLKLTGGIIDPSAYFNENAYANDEFTQFSNQAFVNNRNLFMPAYDWGAAVVWTAGEWKVGGAGMSVGNSGDDDAYTWYAAEVDYRLQTRLGEGNYRFMYSGTSADVPSAEGTGTEPLSGLILSFDQALGKILGVFLRAAWQFNNNAVSFQSGYEGGLNLRGAAWGRDDDNIGIGYGHAHGGTGEIFQSDVLEGYYRFVVNDALALTADVQWMKDSYRDQADIEGLIVGARAVYEF